MWRSAACLALGSVLWLQFGAVQGASRWQLSGGEYLVGLAVGGALVGVLWPDRHLRTGVLIVAPGALALLSLMAQGARIDTFWWVLTVVVGVYLVAGSHLLSVEVRRRMARLRGRPRHP